MSETYLDAIVAHHRSRAAHDPRHAAQRVVAPVARPSLRAALLTHRHEGVAVIAEVKRRSPSKGWLAEGLDAALVARDYERGGASGISVLTDTPHFGGSLDDLVAAAAATTVPLLRKDFVVAPNDVLDAAESGASAVLLIVAALSVDELGELQRVARDVGLDALVEVHTVDELDVALATGATLVGVNRRDLHSFNVDAQRAAAVVASIPDDVVAVAESGFHEPQDVTAAASLGFDGVLVGECFVTATDRAAAVSAFVGAPIGTRRP